MYALNTRLFAAPRAEDRGATPARPRDPLRGVQLPPRSHRRRHRHLRCRCGPSSAVGRRSGLLVILRAHQQGW